MTAVQHTVTRLEVEVGATYDDFRRRYEAAVPACPPDLLDELLRGEGDWHRVKERTDAAAPHGFLIYWRLDVEAMMRLAGDDCRCTAYLMGNHTIAERMFRHQPEVMLHAPLRTVITEGDGTARFCIDQPSTLFSSVGHPAIAAVGLELDRRVADLLRHLGAPVPGALT
jgi:uncharacterized protein (DUF302 family)